MRRRTPMCLPSRQSVTAKTAIDGLDDLGPGLNQIADDRATRRCATPTCASATAPAQPAPSAVTAQHPPDVLGVYVMLPIAAD